MVAQLGFSSPFIEERLYLKRYRAKSIANTMFSSPFIEERLYFNMERALTTKDKELFSSPFIEERLYFSMVNISNTRKTVLVPFYRGAVVFFLSFTPTIVERSSRPLLSRSGCILMELHNKNLPKLGVLVPFYRGAVVFHDNFKN